MFKRILLAVDGSNYSQKVKKWAKEAYQTLPEATFTSFYVSPQKIRAVPVPYGVDFYATELDPDEYVKTPAYQLWEDFADHRRIGYKITEGVAADQICHEAKEGEYDLVVLGSRGHGFLSSAIGGSVSSKVLHHAPCPVLIVR